MFGAQVPDITPITWLLVFLSIFFTPALTMRLLSDEARLGTLELLLTAPIRDFELVVGKWLGGMLFMLSIIAITFFFPLILHNLISPGIDQRVMMSAYLGVVLVMASLLAIGVGVSAIFSNQFASFFITFGIFFFLWFMVSIPASFVQTGTDVFTYLSMASHFTDTLNRGVIQLSDIAYYVSLTALGLFTATTALEIRRWR